MPTAFFDPNGNYYETMTDIEVRDGHSTAPRKPGADYEWDRSAGEWVASERQEPPPTEAQVRAEATRRIELIADSRKQLRLVQRTLRLVTKVTIEGETLTAEEQAEIARKSAVDNRIEAVQEAEAAILAMDPLPSDYADDSRWPR